jgi:hypothetical protein
MKTIPAKAAGTLAISGALLAMSLLGGCGNKGPLVKPSDIPPPAPPAMPAGTPAPAAPAPDAPVPDVPAVPATDAAPAPATPASGAG